MALRPPRTSVNVVTGGFDVSCAGHGHIATHVIKAGAEGEARWHRDQDRRAVAALPATDVRRHENAGYSVHCSCGVTIRDGSTTTRYDVERVGDAHEREHAADAGVEVA